MTPSRRRTRYGRYTGGPDPLAPPVDLAQALEAIGEDVMAGYGPDQALREFLRRGGKDSRGLDDLAAQVARRRRDLLRENGLDGTIREVKELLDSAVLAERGQLARDAQMDEGDRALRQMQLDGLPESPAAAVTELADYDWASSDARQAYEQIKDLLGREVLDQRFAGMKQALEGATEQDRERVAAMMSDLNALLEAHARGEDTTTAFEQFMGEHGDFFPENPSNVEELIDTLAERAAAGQRLLNSMSPEQRQELMQLSQQAFGSPALMESLDRLDATLQQLRPDADWTGSEQFGDGPGLGLGDGTGMLQDIAELDRLSEQLGQSYPGARLDDIDLEALSRQLGDEAGVDARTLSELEKALRDSGYLNRDSSGALTLSPRAMRELGRALLRDVATSLSGRSGQRDTGRVGAAGEQTGASRPWAFGDTEPWDVTRTVGNAVTRTVAGGADAAAGVRLQIQDIEVTETEARTQAAVALCVDTSFSMAMDGRWLPMKRTALALHTLISSRFRGDDLQLITFARHAQTVPIEQLTGLEPMYDKGTNLHHALLLANRFFRKHPAAQPVLLVVTDGEPTAHLEPHGQAAFAYPPHPVTLARTVQELDAVRRLQARTTFFRLGEDPGLARFIDSMARRVDGRVVAPENDELGAAVVDSFLGSRGPRRGGPDQGDLFGGRGFWFG
ncbi:vWA domain-containing protein [Dermacoccaceae bacterium W4C1]